MSKYQEDFDSANKCIIRAGSEFLKNIFEAQKKEGTVLSAERALKICDQTGLSIYYLIIFANSHGMTVDIDGFIQLKEKQPKPRLLRA